MKKFLTEPPSHYGQKYQSDTRQRQYFSNLALSFLSLIKFHRESGHLPSLKNLSPEQIEKNRSLSGQEDWSGVIRHCLAEAAAVDAIAQLLGLSEKDRNTLIQAAILHDYNKKLEIEALKSASGGKTAAYLNIVSQGEQILTKAGIDNQVISIIKSVGHEHSQDVINGRMPFLNQILHYVDSATDGTKLVSPREKFERIKKTYSGLEKEGAYTNWLESKLKIQNDLAQRLGLQDPDQLPSFITQKIKQLAHSQGYERK